jgi:hypothetical protein
VVMGELVERLDERPYDLPLGRPPDTAAENRADLALAEADIGGELPDARPAGLVPQRSEVMTELDEYLVSCGLPRHHRSVRGDARQGCRVPYRMFRRRRPPDRLCSHALRPTPRCGARSPVGRVRPYARTRERRSAR